MTIKQVDEEISGPDSANIPVNLILVKKTVRGKVKYKLTYDLFMPRKGMGEGGVVITDTLEEMQQFIRENVLPSYKIAFDAVTAMTEGKRASLYYWTETGDSEIPVEDDWGDDEDDSDEDE